jgi:hypothetical protein
VPIDLLVLLALALTFFMVAVPLLVFVCVRGETWGDEAAPIVRWLHGRRIKAFAAAAAAGDFVRAELLAQQLMGRAPAF